LRVGFFYDTFEKLGYGNPAPQMKTFRDTFLLKNPEFRYKLEENFFLKNQQLPRVPLYM